MKKIELNVSDEMIQYLYSQAEGFLTMCPDTTSSLYKDFKDLKEAVTPYMSTEMIEQVKDYAAEMAVNLGGMQKVADAMLDVHEKITNNLDNNGKYTIGPS